MHWYERAMPKITDVLPYIQESADDISSIAGVNKIYVWGSFAENILNPNFNVRDIDLLVMCNFDSGDLLAIDKTQDGPLNISKEDLEDEGFNPQAVSFTKKYLKLAKYNIDQWAISRDNQLLHWGPVTDTVREWNDIRKEAEDSASNITGISHKKLCIANESMRKKWKESYSEYIMNFIEGGLVGWYASDTSIEDVMQRSIELTGR